MPLLTHPRGQSPQVFTKDRERIVAYTLAPAGLRQLRDAGLRAGDEVPSRVLAALIRAGLAHSPAVAEAAGQASFNFAGDTTADSLPRCEVTSSTADVHLVVHEEKAGSPVAQLLAPEPRTLLRRTTTLSLPAVLVTSDLLGQLENAGKVPLGSPATATLREWLRLDLARAWEARSHARHTTELPLGQETELPLIG
jgi:hypothetical protein